METQKASVSAASSKSTRLFLALWPSQRELDAVLTWQKSLTWPANVRLTPRRNIHVTLHFIGPVPTARVPELAKSLIAPERSVELRFDGMELWKRGLAVMTSTRSSPDLLTLHGAIGERLRALGLPVESRPFRPHLTLARDAGVSLPNLNAGTLPPLLWRSDGYVLVESRGGRYNTLAAYQTNRETGANY